eukprot:NODE_2088_length_836_cov_2869.252859_g1469_i0.p1 GENE.NODE_2088_length_836_cov_2869.252859_g1469_i0~~NODE_2088_length_836_cov_2869.252859_g1469_i0.p1  ORF type:complete len:221 (+),score=89.28 NODE_2088_length_836_cov_2869.252859_g1469_i0:77-739(+)
MPADKGKKEKGSADKKKAEAPKKGSGTQKASTDKKVKKVKKVDLDRKVGEPGTRRRSRKAEAKGSEAKGSATKKGSASKKVSTAKKVSTTVKATGKLRRTQKGSTTKSSAVTFRVDCSIPAGDGIFDADIMKGFEQFLIENIKVNGRPGRLGEKVKVKAEENTLTIKSFIPFSKRYVKYLTKRYLKKKTLRDWLRVISVNRQTYQLRYFNIHDQEDEGEE